MPEFEKNIVVIGGGNGTSALLEGFLHYDVGITAVVNTTDNGGSTGRLRQQHPGLIGIGDARQCMGTLAANRQLAAEFGSRTVDGHTIGNVALVQAALEAGGVDKIETAIDYCSKLLEVRGSVIPASLVDTNLVLLLKNKQHIFGEYEVAHAASHIWDDRGILSLTPEVPLNPRAAEAIRQADAIVLAPGHFRGSILPALLPSGMKEAVQNSKGPLIMVVNLVNNHQTFGFRDVDYVHELERQTGLVPDSVIVHDHTMHPLNGLESVLAAKDSSLNVIVANLLSEQLPSYDQNDKIAAVRSPVRHNGRVVGGLVVGSLHGA